MLAGEFHLSFISFFICYLTALWPALGLLDNVKLIYCLALHGRNPMRNVLKSFFFHEKKVDVRKRIFFLFYQIVMKCFYMQEFKC